MGTIRLVVFDIDGVITDGKVLVDAAGREQKCLNQKDIDGIFELKRRGFLLAAITGEDSDIVSYFETRFPWDYFYRGCKEKHVALHELERRTGLGCEQICYIGDGKYDVEPISYAGLGVCPADAVDEAKEVAKIVLHHGGGNGCVWEMVSILERYGKEVSNRRKSRMKKRVADIIMDILVENGITDAFSVVGGGAMHLNNAFAKCESIHKYYNHHEQACAMSAEAYVRTSGRLPVVCVTTGPGGTNALTGVLCAWQDSLPMLVLSGQVRYAISVPASGLELRQRGEQEFQIVPAVRHMTKYAKTVINPLEIRKELQKAIDIATSGRRGPVWLDIPLDVQGAIVEVDDVLPPEENAYVEPCVTEEELVFIREELATAKRPCLLVGSGVRVSNTVEEFREYAEQLGIPVVAGIHVADAMSFSSPLYYGMSGTIGPRLGNFILQNADVILVLGNSLHLTQTGFNQALFAPRARIIMVDIDQNEALKPGLNIYRFIRSGLESFFAMAGKSVERVPAPREWIEYCNRLRERFPVIEVPKNLDMDGRVRQNYFWSIFDQKEPGDCIVAYGNSMGVAGVVQKSIRRSGQRLIANFWVGTMGNDLPEAFGAAIASNHEVICCTGDGSIMMNLQELETIMHYDVPVKIILFSNDGYGTIRNTCKNFFDGTKVGCDPETGVGMPNFKKVVEAFGYRYRACRTNREAEECINWIFSEGKHAVLEVFQDVDDVYEPKLTSRLLKDNTFSTPALHDMAPLIEKEELEKWMW